jgi:hypothetical protein
MKGRTYFRAYQLCEVYKSIIEIRRSKHNMGIAVDKDADALEWQHLNRQQHKFKFKILELLERRNGEAK